MWEGGMASGGFFWIFPLIFIVACLFMMFGMRRGGMGCMGMGHGSHEDKDEKKESPVDIAKRRYASGEIDKEEYQSILSDLEKSQE